MNTRDFKRYRRFLIQLSPQNVIIIHHFHQNDGFKQMEIHEDDKVYMHDWEQYEKSAKQFFDQLEGHYCDKFVEALLLEATKRLIESDKARLKMARLNKDTTETYSRAQKAINKAAELISNG